MQALIFFFNELSAPAAEPNHDAFHKLWANNFAALFVELEKIRSDFRIWFSVDISNLPFNHLKSQQRDLYRRLIRRIKPRSGTDFQLDNEVRFNGSPTLGFTLAQHSANLYGHGWSISFDSHDSNWKTSYVQAQKYKLLDDGLLDGPFDCQIEHISSHLHISEWREKICDWGLEVSSSAILDYIDGHPLVMYSAPAEHGPAHVHLLERKNSRVTLAKYRIDNCSRMQGPPTWDSPVSTWIECYRPQLVRSWDECQKGRHPFKILATPRPA